MFSVMRVLAALSLAAFVSGACQSAEPTRADTAIVDCGLIGVQVSPANAVLYIGDTLSVKAYVSPCYPDAQHDRVRWMASNTSVATVDSLTGFVRAGGVGTASIIATLVSDPTQAAAMTLRVTP
jgi:uncharacterized protein YjdB